MIQGLVSGSAALLAEALRYSEVTSSTPGTDTASHLTLTWLVAVLVLIGLALIGFRKSKRTHLD